MSLQSIAATVAASRPRGIRRLTAPLLLALTAVAIHDLVTANGLAAVLMAQALAH